MNDYGLLIDQVNGQKKEPPIYFDRPGNLGGKNWSFDRYDLEQKIGMAFVSGNQTEFDKAVLILRSHINKRDDIRFVLQKRTFDTKNYIETGKVTQATDLKTFSLEFQ